MDERRKSARTHTHTFNSKQFDKREECLSAKQCLLCCLIHVRRTAATSAVFLQHDCARNTSNLNTSNKNHKE